jgi:misacylated tRNA(Ala) deacylase
MTKCVFHQDAYARSCEARVARVDAGGVVLDRTVFYPLGGGQPGDSGYLRCADGTQIDIVDTRKGESGEVMHVLAPQAPVPAPGTPVEAVIAWSRRHTLMRYHTCLHLLCAVVDAPVSGGRMGEDKAHLDFDIEMDKLVADDIERRLNELVTADLAVECGEISDAELDANPALVKTMSVQPPRGQGRVRTISIPGVDLQPCGGTHVRSTAEIGPVRVARIRSEGRRNKRVTIVLERA